MQIYEIKSNQFPIIKAHPYVPPLLCHTSIGSIYKMLFVNYLSLVCSLINGNNTDPKKIICKSIGISFASVCHDRTVKGCLESHKFSVCWVRQENLANMDFEQ